MYENDSIFDKFEVVFLGDGKNVMIGSYNNNFMIYFLDLEKEVEVVFQVDKFVFKVKKVGVFIFINLLISLIVNGKKGGLCVGSLVVLGQG